MSMAPGSTRRTIAPHSSSYLAPPHTLSRTILLALRSIGACASPTAPLPPAATPAPASGLPASYGLDSVADTASAAAGAAGTQDDCKNRKQDEGPTIQRARKRVGVLRHGGLQMYATFSSLDTCLTPAWIGSARPGRSAVLSGPRLDLAAVHITSFVKL
jgi:hypothetical protein